MSSVSVVNVVFLMLVIVLNGIRWWRRVGWIRFSWVWGCSNLVSIIVVHILFRMGSFLRSVSLVIGVNMNMGKF